jgi:hypothetical protein
MLARYGEHDITQQGRRHDVTKVMAAERLVEAWNRITSDIIDYVWRFYLPEWHGNQDGEEAETKDDDYRHLISLDVPRVL